MTTTAPLKLPGTPKPWMNRAVRTAMSLPVLRRIMAKTFAVITVTGARTGRQYSTPIQFTGVDGKLVVLSQQHRKWWRNIRTRPDIVLTIGGRSIGAHAEIPTGDDARKVLAQAMSGNPRTARFYGLELGEDGTIDPVDVDRLADAFVPIVITTEDAI